jgi:hypothetical protein
VSLLACVPVLAAEQLSAPALAEESICSRLDAPAAAVRNPGSARPWAAKQIYYPVRSRTLRVSRHVVRDPPCPCL